MLNTKEFNRLLDIDNIDLSKSDIFDIEECLERYPYFESLRFIYLKYLYNTSYDLFKQKLKKTVVLINDREKLFYYIHSDDFNMLSKTNINEVDAKSSTDLLINAFFETIGEKAGEVLDLEKQTEANISSMDYFTYLKYETNNKKINSKTEEHNKKINVKKYNDNEIEEETDIELLTDSDTFENNENHGNKKDEIYILEPVFNIEEELSSLEDLQSSESAPMKHQEIIDSFLEKEYVPLKELQKSQLVNDSDFDQDDNSVVEETTPDEGEMFFTETLSKIYIKQQRYEKAYEIIKHLSLNYPRKNIYFAEQLDFLEKLILNSKYNKK